MIPRDQGALGQSPQRLPRASRGLTLLEVLVALSLAGMLLVGGRMLAGTVADAADGIATRAADIDRDANGRRLLRRLARQMEVGSLKAPFGGDETHTEFTSACTGAGGWQERCRVALGVEPHDSGFVLMAALSTGEALQLARARERMSLAYIGAADRGGTWFRVWEPGIAMPVALAVLLDRDTLIVGIGDAE